MTNDLPIDPTWAIDYALAVQNASAVIDTCKLHNSGQCAPHHIGVWH